MTAVQRSMRVRLAFLPAPLLAVFLVGCFAAAPEGTSAGAPAEVSAIDLLWQGSGCAEILLGVLVDPDHARRFLPPGFEPADAAAALGAPVASGLALAAINAIRCGDSSWDEGPMGVAELIVAVEPPEVQRADFEPAPKSAYLMHQFITAPSFVDVVKGTGFAASQIAIDAQFTLDAGGSAVEGRGILTDEEGELARFAVAAAPGTSESSSVNQYHVTPGGLVLHAITWNDAPLSFGQATCTLREGSLVAELLGGTTCGGQRTIGVLMGPFDLHAQFRFMPGAVVTTRTV